MASSIPTQERVVDPFASYNSNVVNRLTEILSKGRNALISTNDLQVTVIDSTSVAVSEGYALKDDVLIHVTAPKTVDFYDIDQYTSTDPFPTPGYNYIVLDYSYVKSRPAPQASIKILRSTERAALAASPNLMLIKVVKLTTTGPHIIESLHDFDPENISNKRETIFRYATGEGYLPVHTRSRDQSRIVYDHESDSFYFGISDRWVGLDDGSSIIKDTSALALGDLAYINSTGGVGKAISKFPISTVDGVVIEVGTETSNPPGRVKTTGPVEDVPVDTNVAGSVNVGDLLFLSINQAGKVTNVESYPYSQFVGRCTDVIDSTTVNMLFVRGFVSPTLASADLGAGISGIVLGSGSWHAGYDGTAVVYYQDVDITGISGRDAIFAVRDVSDGELIEPYKIELLSDDVARIWMTDNTHTLDITILGPAISIGVDTIKAVRSTLSAGSWILQGGNYYQDVDITDIGTYDVVVSLRDTADDMKVKPVAIEIDSTSTVRVWMTDNVHTLEATVIGATPSTDLLTASIITIDTSDWSSSGGQYYYDIDTTIIDNQDIIMSARNDATNTVVEVGDVEMVDANTVRIWMPGNTVKLHVIVMG